jgi:hypothetical protein
VLALFVGGELSQDRAADVGAYWMRTGSGRSNSTGHVPRKGLQLLPRLDGQRRGRRTSSSARRSRCAIAVLGHDVPCTRELIALGADPNLETLYMPDCLEGHAPRFEGTLVHVRARRHRMPARNETVDALARHRFERTDVVY